MVPFAAVRLWGRSIRREAFGRLEFHQKRPNGKGDWDIIMVMPVYGQRESLAFSEICGIIHDNSSNKNYMAWFLLLYIMMFFVGILAESLRQLDKSLISHACTVFMMFHLISCEFRNHPQIGYKQVVVVPSNGMFPEALTKDPMLLVQFLSVVRVTQLE